MEDHIGKRALPGPPENFSTPRVSGLTRTDASRDSCGRLRGVSGGSLLSTLCKSRRGSSPLFSYLPSSSPSVPKPFSPFPVSPSVLSPRRPDPVEVQQLYVVIGVDVPPVYVPDQGFDVESGRVGAGDVSGDTRSEFPSHRDWTWSFPLPLFLVHFPPSTTTSLPRATSARQIETFRTLGS